MRLFGLMIFLAGTINRRKGPADDVVGLVAYHVAKIATTRFVRVGE